MLTWLVVAPAAVAHDTPTTSDVSPATQEQLQMALDDPSLALAPEGLTSAECSNGFAGPYECRNVDLESYVPLPGLGLGTGNDIWGWEDPQTGREYALMGTATTTGFVDVTDPRNPVLIGQLPTEGAGPYVLWRDIKVDGNHAFIVSEIDGSGMQVFDLRRLRGHSGPPQVFDADATYHGTDDDGEQLSYSHNIFVNTRTDRAYIVGSNTCRNDEEHGGLHIVDISEPESPRFMGCARVDDADGDTSTESDNYVHDVECVVYDGPDGDHQGREICFGSNENAVVIYDTTDAADPQVLSVTAYPSAQYTHQGSLTRNKAWFLFGDELDESGGTVPNTTTYVMDVADIDSPPTPVPFHHATESIDHNLYVHGNHVYESNYAAGLRILEFTNRSLSQAAKAPALSEIGYFDVVPLADPTEYAGTWSNYRFESGTTVVSAIENAVSGLFVLQPDLPSGAKGKSGR